MNRVLLVGNLVRDIELKKTTSGKDVTNFTIAINNFSDDVSYIDCVAWNKQAEFLSNYAKKGNKIGVDGRLSQRSYQKQDGTKANVIEVVVDQVELLERRKEETTFDTGGKNVVNADTDLPF